MECTSTYYPFYNLFSVGLGSPPAFPFEAKSQLASSPASKVQSHIRTNNMPFGYKTQIHLIFSAKDLCILNICCTFAASKVKRSYYAYIIYIIWFPLYVLLQ